MIEFKLLSELNPSDITSYVKELEAYICLLEMRIDNLRMTGAE